MSWQKFKESWKSWPKDDKIYFVGMVLTHTVCMMAIILGFDSFFGSHLLSDGVGSWLLWLGTFGYLMVLYVNTNKRIDKLKEKVNE